MGALREYLMQVTAAAVICGIVTAITGKKGSGASIIRLMTVLFMAMTIIGPIASLKLDQFTDYFADIQAESDAFVAAGSESSREKIGQVIKEKAEAYILDKAVPFGANIAVALTLSDGELPVPVSVRICGAVSPYAKSRLSQIIWQDLGIPMEEQKWES